MKLITLNTHSLLEDNYKNKLNDFIEAILIEEPDVFALQEVNQSISATKVEDVYGYVDFYEQKITIREDNHALSIAKLLGEKGIYYEWSWIPIKLGYGIYEEGLALFSRTPIKEIKAFYVSKTKDYMNWRTRMLFGIRNAAYSDTWFFSAHFGWWDDKEEPFYHQWDKAKLVLEKTVEDGECFVMGDFNCPDNVLGQGFDYVRNTGWKDTWEMAKFKDSGLTVGNVIDGWRDRVDIKTMEGMRLDYIWCNKQVNVKKSEVVFNEKKYNIVSDHYGVMIEIDDK